MNGASHPKILLGRVSIICKIYGFCVLTWRKLVENTFGHVKVPSRFKEVAFTFPPYGCTDVTKVLKRYSWEPNIWFLLCFMHLLNYEVEANNNTSCAYNKLKMIAGVATRPCVLAFSLLPSFQYACACISMFLMHTNPAVRATGTYEQR